MSNGYKIQSVEFMGSAVELHQCPTDQLPQIVLAGRSNVGKSSFINAMLNRKAIAKVSQTPGKTRLLNFFFINKRFYFVDIPGYGYAKVSNQMKESFQVMIERYLASTNPIRLAVLLLDLRHSPTQDDLQMAAYFKTQQVPIMFVCTKADKLSNNQRFKQLKLIKEVIQFDHTDQFCVFSAETKLGLEECWQRITNQLGLEMGNE